MTKKLFPRYSHVSMCVEFMPNIIGDRWSFKWRVLATGGVSNGLRGGPCVILAEVVRASADIVAEGEEGP